MSKSVKSQASSRRPTPKQVQNAQIKSKIKQILLTVKQERQHLQNLLHQNDIQLKYLHQQYQESKFENDFDDLSNEQLVVLEQIAEGLKEVNLEPTQILGQNLHLKEDRSDLKKISKEEIVRIQEMIISRLEAEIRSE